jgi:hypothetical protein
MVKKMWYIYTMEYCPATKKNELMPLAGKRIELEIIMLSEINQTACCMQNPGLKK